MSETIRVLVCDDDPLVRRGLTSYVGSAADMRLVAAVGTCAEARQVLGENDVDVLLLDVRMPGTSGPELARLLTKDQTRARIIYLTSFPDERLTADTLHGVVAGVLTKDVEPDTLLHAIRAARGGLTIMASDAPMTGVVLPPRTPVPVNEREREVLVHLCAGRSNHEIAQLMYVSESTVKSDLATLMARFHVTNRVSLALAATDAAIA